MDVQQGNRKKVPKKMNENISKLKCKYVNTVLKNIFKLHKYRREYTYLYSVYIIIYIFNFQVP